MTDAMAWHRGAIRAVAARSRPTRQRGWLARVGLVAGTAWVALGLAAPLAHAAPRTINVNGSYELLVHVNAGVTIPWQLSLSTSGHQLKGTMTSSSSGGGVKGTLHGVKLKFTYYGPNGYTANFSGTTSCNGGFLQGGWIDVAAEGGNWTAKRGTASASAAVCGGYQVSGRITRKGVKVTGVAGIPVTAHCASGSTTTSDARGDYEFVLNPGSCQISIRPPAGFVATPKQRTVQVRSQNIAGVDFQVACGGVNAVAGAAAAAGNPGCLDVSVKRIGASRSGLAIYRHFSPDDASRAFFLAPYTKQCASGCTNVLVTVTDAKTGQPVTGATVNASVTDIRGVNGAGYLCDQAAPTDCGTHLLGLTTDADGQAHLLYWAPGLIKDEALKVLVVARDGTNVGSGETGFTVKPYLMYAHTGTLTRKEADELAYWAAGKGVVGRLGKLIGGLSHLEKALSFSLSALEGAEVVAETAVKVLAAVESVTPIIGVLEVAHFGTELWERQGFIASFLDALDLSAIGIADNPVERFVSGAPSSAFENQLANLGTAAPFHVGAGGVLWDYAKTLAFLFANHDVAFGAQFVHLKIYEVSVCAEGELCGPGYRNYLAGIRPELYFEISAERNRRAQSFPLHSFKLGYDPNAWAETQHELQGLLG